MARGERTCFFVSDLHGMDSRYEKLYAAVEEERPRALLLGGDMLPKPWASDWREFLADVVFGGLARLSERLLHEMPVVYAIPGNLDSRDLEAEYLRAEREGTLRYAHGRRLDLFGQALYGYGCVPASPFRFKDWERFDVARTADPGCLPPEAGQPTIEQDLQRLTGGDDLHDAVLLVHTPPFSTNLDRVAGGARRVGSVALRRLIEERQPRLTLHGHIHESPRLSGSWLDRIGNTVCFSAAHDGPELALVAFDPTQPLAATRRLL